MTQSGGISRDSWGTRAGFILAAVGSAVGLGNMWRFSYVAAEGGGAAFVLLYLVFVAVIGIPLMTAEFVVGRMVHMSPVQALKRLGGDAWTPLGLLFVFCGLGILSYYSVIAGWTMRYAVDALRGAIPEDAGAYFGAVGTGWPAVVTHLLFMACTIFIVVGGIKKGLERTAIVLMPVLFLLLIGLAVWASTLEGGAAGYAYYLKPQLGELFNPQIITSAAGQAFFSLSLGMGALMTYASYLTSKENLGREAAVVALTDFGVAFVAGLFVFPIIFHFDLSATIGLGNPISDNTVGTLFISIPPALGSLGSIGNMITGAFFVMLFFAAITSSISLLEVVVSAVIDSWHWPRTKATLVFGLLITLLGIPSAFNLNFLDFADKLVGNVMLMIGGLFTALLVGYTVRPQADAELAEGMTNATARNAWMVFVRYVAPPLLILVLAFSIPDLITKFKTLVGM
ncbi:MAG TPA: sodium-dependent transporter [Gemmatimonadales bacterium]